MGNSAEEEIRKSIEEVLTLYNIKLEEELVQEEEQKRERYGDYSEIINKTQEKLDELQERAAKIYEKTGMSREQIQEYASNPDHFTPEQWKALQRVREACEKFHRQTRDTIGEENLKVVSNSKKERKKQSQRFAKKKNWIPL